MENITHQELSDKIWAVANKLRGPYRPPQYRRVMLPLIVLRRLDCVLEPTKDKVLDQLKALKKKGLSGAAIEKALAKVASKDRDQPLYNISPFTFSKLLGDSNGIAKNLTAYIKGFSPKVREIFEKFEFEKEIEKLEEANRLFEVIKEFASIDLHPDRVPNLAMGYVFENLIRRFNEQANEEAGDHFTPREVIRLMAHLIYTGDEDIYKPGISRTIYDPACGTGGMLSVSEEYIREHNNKAHLTLYGQDYNPESYAICCSDMLIKDEPADNILPTDTLDQSKGGDGFAGKTFHYMLANPPFGVEWKPQQKFIEKEHVNFGFDGRFGPGLPRINDGALLFLLHMLSKRKPSPDEGGEGSKIAIVFNGSPLFTGDAASGESNIRRWIIENDWLDAIIALPDQLFYNTGIYTYVWLVTNRKPKTRRGKVQLIDGTRHYKKMKKSLGNKRNQLSEDHIKELTRLYAEGGHDALSAFESNGNKIERICSKVFDNRDFGYLKLTIERPLRLNFQASPERIARIQDAGAFLALAESKKRKDRSVVAKEVGAGRETQSAILTAAKSLDPKRIYKNREKFWTDLESVLEEAGVNVTAALRKDVLSALSERDPTADICTDANGNPEPDPELRDTESVPLPKAVTLPLPIGYENRADNTELVELVRDHCLAYFDKEVKPHWPDAWIDFSKTKIGYEIPINRHFYVYEAPRPLADIEQDIKKLEGEILDMLKAVA
ncbi:class I SAM-dependent DNA methyltransferase [Bradyrhizobium symbiodeficiens]|uniref:type I restriction-modification system subunit M n=1 Tax=Bradyrhizobium symbiodeficiens TaxID=1404367 RepID=UPI0030CE1386